MKKIDNILVDYRKTSQQSLFANKLLEEMQSARLSVMRYRIDNQDEFIEGVHDNVDTLVADIEGLDRTIVHDSKILEEMDAVSVLAQEYATIFDKAVEQQELRYILVDELDALGAAMTSKVSGLVRAAIAASEFYIANEISSVLEELLMARLHANKFLLNNDVTDKNRALELLENVQDNAEFVEMLLEGKEDLMATASLIVKETKEFKQKLLEVQEVVIMRNETLLMDWTVLGRRLGKA